MEATDHTRAVRAGIETDRGHHAVVPPVYLSTNYAFEGLEGRPPYDYSRSGNPTRAILADALADLERGAGAVVTGSGMAAVSTALHAFVRPGSRIVVPHDCYGGSWRLFHALERVGWCDVVTLDLTAPDAAERVARAQASMVWVETPSNPLLRLTDLDAVTRAAHDSGALIVADNTFCSPALCRPIEHGVDAVIHSTTKYINGHSDVIGGVLVAATDEHAEQARWWANTLGATGNPFDAYLTLRGLRTLALRMKQHQANARALADAALVHPAASAVHYPGLADHPGHALAARQQDGPGAMLSIEIADGVDGVRRFVDALVHFSLAESLGGVESLVCHPATMTHAAMPPQAQADAGITPGLVRISPGIEDTSDLLADLTRGLDAVSAG